MRIDFETKMTLMSIYSQLAYEYARMTKELIKNKEEYVVEGNIERVNEIYSTCDEIARLLSHVEDIILNSNR